MCPWCRIQNFVMGKSRFIELMAKNMGKTATEAELEELKVFMEQFPDYQRVQNVTDAFESKMNAEQVVVSEQNIDRNLEELWVKIRKAEKTKVEVVKRSPAIFNYWGWAAAVFLIGFFGLFFSTRKSADPSRFSKTIYHKIYVPYGQTRSVVLPDGSTIKLNAGSTLLYPVSFAKTNREVKLEGEGFFKVTKNAAKPFLVHTNNLTVKVLGTVFNVKAYQNDKNTETTLLKGKVQIELKNKPEKQIFLMPNEKIIVANDLSATRISSINKSKVSKGDYQIRTLAKSKVEDMEETAWLTNTLVFTNQSFEGVAKQIERKYNVKIIFEDISLKNEIISGVLEDESLDEALQIIRLTTPFKFRTTGRVIYVLHE